ncbi:UNVERIFIED_CONTAM: hypothetical protein HDU68_009490 [Siphonaria sp. JEL0065]|nr:hypothetical protein HDU68_009490 [Siphonaria sp. JEL0065]
MKFIAVLAVATVSIAQYVAPPPVYTAPAPIVPATTVAPIISKTSIAPAVNTPAAYNAPTPPAKTSVAPAQNTPSPTDDCEEDVEEDCEDDSTVPAATTPRATPMPTPAAVTPVVKPAVTPAATPAAVKPATTTQQGILNGAKSTGILGLVVLEYNPTGTNRATTVTAAYVRPATTGLYNGTQSAGTVLVVADDSEMKDETLLKKTLKHEDDYKKGGAVSRLYIPPKPLKMKFLTTLIITTIAVSASYEPYQAKATRTVDAVIATTPSATNASTSAAAAVTSSVPCQHMQLHQKLNHLLPLL